MSFLSKCSRYSIELSRPNGVYIAGETIEGVLKLDTKEDIKCRGVQLSLQGIGYCWFHRGSGDDRNDYSNTRKYFYRQITAFGNFYRTALLDGAGKDAVFDPTAGSGDITINLDGLDLSTLTLAVRPMDYDWGKRDDLLGEVLVPVEATLLGDKAGTDVTFPLKRKGKEEKGEVTLSATVATLASGTDVLQLKCVKATGLRPADWFGKNDVYVQAYIVDPKTDAGAALPVPDTSLVLPKGELVVPFAIKLPSAAMPSSLEYSGWGDRAYVRYSLYSNIDIAFRLDPSCRKYITILSSELPRPELFAPRIRGESEPNRVYGCDCCCFKCCDQGTLQFSAAIDKAYLNPGGPLFVTAAGRSDADAFIKFKVNLVMMWKLKAQGKHESGTQTWTLHSETLSKGGTVNWPASEPKAFKVPTIPPTFLGSTTTLWGGDPVTWHYRLDISMAGVGAMATAITWHQPVFVGAFPLSALKALPAYKGTMLGGGDLLAPITIDAKGDAESVPKGQAMLLDFSQPLPVEVSNILITAVKAEDQVAAPKDAKDDMNSFGDFDHHVAQYPNSDDTTGEPLVGMPVITITNVEIVPSATEHEKMSAAKINPEPAPAAVQPISRE